MSAIHEHPVRFEPRTGTYRRAGVEGMQEPLVEDESRTALEPGRIRVKVEASGLGNTDIPGCECVGIVEEIGASVTEVAPGDRVAMSWLGFACGTCTYCLSGWERLCLEQTRMGSSLDGGCGEYAIALARHVVKVPGSSLDDVNEAIADVEGGARCSPDRVLGM